MTNEESDWNEEGEDVLRTPACSFCGKTNEEVAKLIAGPESYICDECVSLCAEIIDADAVLSSEHGEGDEPPGTHEIRALLEPFALDDGTRDSIASLIARAYGPPNGER